MAIVYNWPTSATLAGAVDVSRMHRAAGQEDLGSKVEKIISAINNLQSGMSSINESLGSAAASMAGASMFSAFSAFGAVAGTTGLSAGGDLSNFRA